MAERVVVVGSVNLDTTADVDHLPARGETVLASAVRAAVGGKGANQAVACARQGVPTSFVGAAGDDASGAALLAALDAEGVDLTCCRRVPGVPSGQALITVDGRGDNTIVVAAGANAALTAAHVRASVVRCTAVAVVLAQLEVPVDVVAAAFEAARRSGAITILNPAPARPLAPELLRLCDVVVPNETEAASLAGGAPPREAIGIIADAAEAATVIVTVGPGGALVRRPGSPVTAVPSPPVTAVDAVAAGDAFCGVLAAALAEGRGIDDAVRRAVAAGAHAVTVPGALPSLPFAADVERLLGG